MLFTEGAGVTAGTQLAFIVLIELARLVTSGKGLLKKQFKDTTKLKLDLCGM